MANPDPNLRAETEQLPLYQSREYLNACPMVRQAYETNPNNSRRTHFAVVRLPDGNTRRIDLEDGFAAKLMQIRSNRLDGGYLVVATDGYLSWMGTSEFEAKFRRISDYTGE